MCGILQFCFSQVQRVFCQIFEARYLSGVTRQPVTFLVSPRKVTKRKRPRPATPLVFPALLALSGGCPQRRASLKNEELRSRQHLLLTYPSHVRRREKQISGGALGEDCLSVSPYLRDRVPQPRLIFIFCGNPQGGKPGSPSFCLLLLGEARKSK